MPEKATVAVSKPDLSEVEHLTERFANFRSELAVAVSSLEEQIDAVKRRLLPGIKELVIAAVDVRDLLSTEIQTAADDGLFDKPKTRTFHGIRVGVSKAKDTVEMDDEARVIARMRALLPEEQSGLLIRVKEGVDKAAVKDLDSSDHKRLGIRIVPGDDQVVIKPQDSEVSKLVDALLGKGDDVEEL